MKCKHCKRTLLKDELCSCSGAVKERMGESSGSSSYSNIGLDDSKYKSTSNYGSSNYNSSHYSSSNYNSSNFGSSNHNTGSTPDIDLSESTRGSSTNTNDNLCNHNGTYFHQKNDWSNTQKTSTPLQSNFVYADVPKKINTARKTGCIIAVVIMAISFMIPIIMTYVFLNDQFVSSNDYSYEYSHDEFDDGYTSESGQNYETGEVIDGVYYNYWADLEMELPDGYEIASEEDSNDYFTTYEDIALHAFNPDTYCHVLMASYEYGDKEMDSQDTAKEIIDIFIDGYDSYRDEDEENYEMFGPYDKEIAGHTYACYDYQIDDVLFITVACRRIDDGYFYIVVDEYKEKDAEDILKSMTSIN